MSLADAPIAQEGFYVTHFLTVKDQAKSRDFYVKVLGGKVVKLEKPLLHQAGQFVAHPQFRGRTNHR
jgi:hypothetical protein